MLKKLFQRLTQSSESLFLQELKESAALLQSSSPHLAVTLRKVAAWKQQIDSQAAESASLEIENKDQLVTELCQQLRDRVRQLAKLEAETAGVLTAADSQRFESHFSQLKEHHIAIMRGCATLQRTATGKPSSRLDDSQHIGDDSPLAAAVDALSVELRTAERIRNELGG